MPDQDIFAISVTQVRWQLQLTASAPVFLPQWKGSLLRGALGWALRSVAGAAPAPPWPHTSPGFYEAIFEPQTAWSSPRAVPLWGLVCADQRTRYEPGDIIEGELHLLGDWPAWTTSVWEEAFRLAASTGLGEKRHQATLTQWDITPIAASTAPQLAAGSAIELHTQTPCRLQEGQKDLRALDPTTIVRGLVRRLRAVHIQTRDDDPFAEGLGSWYFDQAPCLRAIAGETLRVPLERRSAHQGRKHPMPALAGWLRIVCDDWQPWAPLFALAPWLHIGRQPHFGLGAVEVRWQIPEVFLSEKQAPRLNHDMSALETP